MKRKFIVSFSDYLTLKDREDANLLLVKPLRSINPFCFDFEVIRFQSRLALEEFNKRANLQSVVKTQVPLNCVIYKHQSDSDARAKIFANTTP